MNKTHFRTDSSGWRKESDDLNWDGSAPWIADNPITKAKLGSELGWYGIGLYHQLNIIDRISRNTIREGHVFVPLGRVNSRVGDKNIVNADMRLTLAGLRMGYEKPTCQTHAERADPTECRETRPPNARLVVMLNTINCKDHARESRPVGSRRRRFPRICVGDVVPDLRGVYCGHELSTSQTRLEFPDMGNNRSAPLPIGWRAFSFLTQMVAHTER